MGSFYRSRHELRSLTKNASVPSSSTKSESRDGAISGDRERVPKPDSHSIGISRKPMREHIKRRICAKLAAYLLARSRILHGSGEKSDADVAKHEKEDREGCFHHRSHGELVGTQTIQPALLLSPFNGLEHRIGETEAANAFGDLADLLSRMNARVAWPKT